MEILALRVKWPLKVKLKVKGFPRDCDLVVTPKFGASGEMFCFLNWILNLQWNFVKFTELCTDLCLFFNLCYISILKKRLKNASPRSHPHQRLTEGGHSLLWQTRHWVKAQELGSRPASLPCLNLPQCPLPSFWKRKSYFCQIHEVVQGQMRS